MAVSIARVLYSDDAMAILAAFNCEEDIEIVGITSLFGNVPVGMATENCLILRDMMSAVKESAASIPVCAGSSTSFLGEEKHRIADFVHGNDGFGNKGPKEKSTVRTHLLLLCAFARAVMQHDSAELHAYIACSFSS